MKVTIDDTIFEGTSEEIYEVLSKLGYKFEKKIVLNTPSPIINPITEPYKCPSVPQWVQPYTIGDPPPGTYPHVWCGSGSTIRKNDEDIISMNDNNE